MSIPVHARVEKRAGRATLLLNERPVAPLLYALSDCPGARWTWEEVPARNIALFASQGVRLFQADISLEMLLGPDGRIDSEAEFEDDAHRPLVLRRRTIEWRPPAGGA